MDKHTLLRSITPFAHLSDEHLVLLAERLGVQTFERGETIFYQGSRGSVLYIIVSGQVRIYTVSETGQELSVTIFRAGDFFGELALLDELPRSASAEAMSPTRTLTLHRAEFLATVQACPIIAVAILEILATRLRNSTVHAEHLASYSAPQRVIQQLLLLAADRQADQTDHPPIELQLTQDDLASLSGTSRETVNRVLASLRYQGCLRVERARIHVLDVRCLKHALMHP